MSAETKIEWCDSTFNPWIGCTRVSPACDDCYAARSTPARTLGIAWGTGEPRRRTSDANWRLPLRWERNAAEFHAQHGRRRRVFCASLADVFDNEVDPAWRADLFRLIADTPSLDWLLLTKRIGNAGNMLPVPFDFDRIYPNVWLGATVVTQAEVDRDVPKLLATLAARRFLSIEPMLGPISLRWLAAWPQNSPTTAQKPGGHTDHLDGLRRLDWVIAGGESGPRARPASPDWFRTLRDECAAAGVPYLFKQWGAWLPMLGQMEGIPVTKKATLSDGWVVGHAGKKNAGRLLDGIQHSSFPRSAA